MGGTSFYPPATRPSDQRSSEARATTTFGLVALIGTHEVPQLFWDETLVDLHLFGGDETLQGCVHSHSEDVHEERTAEVSDHAVDAEKHVGRLNLRVDALQHQEPKQTCSHEDEELTNEVNDRAETTKDAEARRIPQDQKKRILGGLAKVGAHERYLDVGVLVQKLDALLEAPQATCDGLCDHLHDFVLLRLCLLGQEVHEPLDRLDNCEDQGPKGEGPQVVQETILHGRTDGKEGLRAGAVLVLVEEPDARSACDSALPSSHSEGIVPEEHEEGKPEAVVQHVAGWCATPTSWLCQRGIARGCGTVEVCRSGRVHVGARAGGVVRAISLRIGGIRVLRHVPVRHLRHQEGNQEEP
mmetsp:Transcript_12140/g.30229  ORF Transcript_12140/g.30229 Transcript_12140/m.30229 type:complete len:356 (-) Transcript_12140:1487-2554(-)